METTQPSSSAPVAGTIGKHDWCIRDCGGNDFAVFVDDCQLSYRKTADMGRAYATQVISRLQADGDYYLYLKPAGFMPPLIGNPQ